MDERKQTLGSRNESAWYFEMSRNVPFCFLCLDWNFSHRAIAREETVLPKMNRNKETEEAVVKIPHYGCYCIMG